MLKQFMLFIILCLLWYVLSGYDSAFFLGLGAFSAVVSACIYRYLSRGESSLVLTPLGILRLPLYIIWLVKEVVISSLAVTYQVWRLSPSIDPKMVWVKTAAVEDIAVTTYANSITLTPGTTAVRLDKGKILVHALQKTSLDGLEGGAMEQKIINIMQRGKQK